MANIYVASGAVGGSDNSGSSFANAKNCSAEATLRSTIEGASSGDVIRMRQGTYTVTSDIEVPTNVSIIGWSDSSDVTLTSGNYTTISGTLGVSYSITSPSTYTAACFHMMGGTSGQILKFLKITKFHKGILTPEGRSKSVTVDECLIEICADGIETRGDYHVFNAASDIGSNTITATSNGLTNGDLVRFGRQFSGSVLPGGIAEGTEYYVVNQATNSFQISTTGGGSAITLTDGSSTCVWYRRTEDTENTDLWSVTNTIIRNVARTGWWIRYGCGRTSMTGSNLELWGDDGTSYQDCTLDSTTDTFTCASHGFSANEPVAFRFTTVPSGWPTDENGNSGRWKIYYIKTVPTANTFTISSSSGGAQLVSFTSNGSGIKVHRTYSFNSGGSTGIDVGYTSDGRRTDDKNIVLTNIFGGEFSDKSTPATGTNWQGDLIKSESNTTGSVNGGYAIYCADTGIDVKGTWVISNFAVNHCLQAFKSYANAPQKMTLNNCIGIQCHWNGGKQTEARIISAYGWIDANFCTFFDIGNDSSVDINRNILKFQTNSGGGGVNSVVTLTDCLWGFYDANSGAGIGQKGTSSPSITDIEAQTVRTRTTWWNDRGVSSPTVDPLFVDNTDDNFIGQSTNWNSTTYPNGTRGYFYDDGGTPDPGGSTTVITITGVNMAGVTFS